VTVLGLQYAPACTYLFTCVNIMGKFAAATPSAICIRYMYRSRGHRIGGSCERPWNLPRSQLTCTAAKGPHFFLSPRLDLSG
jgi:hypothetical protein